MGALGHQGKSAGELLGNAAIVRPLGMPRGSNIALDDEELRNFEHIHGWSVGSRAETSGRSVHRHSRLGIMGDAPRVKVDRVPRRCERVVDRRGARHVSESKRSTTRVDRGAIRRWDAEGDVRLSASGCAAVRMRQPRSGSSIDDFQRRWHRHRPSRRDLGRERLRRGHRRTQSGPSASPGGVTANAPRRACLAAEQTS